MALRNLISKALLPNLERDLNSAIASQLSSVPDMVDSMLAPSAYAYIGSTKPSGAFQTTGLRKAAVKVHYPIHPEGLFKDKQTSFHHSK